MLNMRPSHWLGVFIIICYHYSDSGIIFPYAVDEVVQSFIAHKGLCGDGHKRAYVVLYGKTQKVWRHCLHINKWHIKLAFLGSSIVKFWNGSKSNFDGENRLMCFGSKLNCENRQAALKIQLFKFKGRMWSNRCFFSCGLMAPHQCDCHLFHHRRVFEICIVVWLLFCLGFWKGKQFRAKVKTMRLLTVNALCVY